MRFFITVVLCALVSSVTAKQLHHGKHHNKYVLTDGTEVTPDPDNKMDLQEEINLTPYVVLTKENMWKAGVPNYEDPKQGYKVKTFTDEQKARHWVYSKTGAHQSINYSMPEGVEPVNGGIGFLETGSGSEGSGSEAYPMVYNADPYDAAEGGSDESGSGRTGGSADESVAFCAECQAKLDALNDRIADVETKIQARKDGGPITGITATKGEIVDVVIHRDPIADIEMATEAPVDVAQPDESGSADEGSEGSGSAAAASFIEKMKTLRSH